MSQEKTKKQESSETSSKKPKEKSDEIIQLDDGAYYRTVAGRIVRFNEDYDNGMIETQLLTEVADKTYFVFKATVYPDCKHKERFFTGYGQCLKIEGNVYTSMEKAETTAIGRALSRMSNNILGAGASEEEIAKANGKPVVQQGIRDVIKEETKVPKVDPKAEPVYDALNPKDKEIAVAYAKDIQAKTSKEELIAIGNIIKDAKLNKAISEELRKEFNKKLRELASRKE